MFKLFKLGCMGMAALVVLLVAAGLIMGDSEETATNKNKDDKADVMIDVNQFSRISSAELVNIMGEPDKVEDYEWSVPKTNESIVGKLYIYDDNKYEFILFDGQVARLNIYAGTYMGYSDEKFSFENEEAIFEMFNITPNEYFRKVVDNGFTLRYTPVSNQVAEVWIEFIEDNQFELAKITYNLNYY